MREQVNPQLRMPVSEQCLSSKGVAVVILTFCQHGVHKLRCQQASEEQTTAFRLDVPPTISKRLVTWCKPGTVVVVVVVVVLRGTIVNRTYGIHKNLYIKPFLLAIFGPINYGPPY